jgi:hypothetical protein
MVADDNDRRTSFEKAIDAANVAAEAVLTTTESLAAAIDNSRRPGGVLNQLSRMTRVAPLRSLAAAFVIGLIIVRRR